MMLHIILAEQIQHVDVSLAEETIEHLKHVNIGEWLTDHFVEILLVGFTWWLAKSTKDLATSTNDLANATVSIETDKYERERIGVLRGIRVNVESYFNNLNQNIKISSNDLPDMSFYSVDALEERVKDNIVMMSLTDSEYATVNSFLENVRPLRIEYNWMHELWVIANKSRLDIHRPEQDKELDNQHCNISLNEMTQSMTKMLKEMSDIIGMFATQEIKEVYNTSQQSKIVQEILKGISHGRTP